MKAELDELIDAGDMMVIGSTLRGRGRRSGVEAKFTFWQVWTIEDRKFVRDVGSPQTFAGHDGLMEAFQDFMKRDAAADAMKHDGVHPETVVVLSEGQ